MLSYLVIMAGGALGTALRMAVSQYCLSRWGQGFPIGTLIINISGSLVIGLVFGLTDPPGKIYLTPLVRQFWMVGICGGFTTFSAFSLQTLNLARQGQWISAGLYVVLSVILCLVGVWLGVALAQGINGTR